MKVSPWIGVMLVFAFLMSGCNGDESLQSWGQEIPKGFSKEYVKDQKPWYIKVDWENPSPLYKGFKSYEIVMFWEKFDDKGISYNLQFVNDSFQYSGKSWHSPMGNKYR
jgi:hypothetical protein